MISIQFINDLFGHLEWADATMWRAVLATPPAASDVPLKKRLFHIHSAQYAFLQAWRGEEIERYKAEEFATLDDLLAWARPYYSAVKDFLAELDEARLSSPMPLPWAHYFGRRLGREVAVTTMEETLFQVCSHSVHHRAQVNLQLRGHGAEPPLIDYIAWVWAGRPEAGWDDGSG